MRFRPRSYSYVGQTPMLDIFDKPIAEWDLLIKLGFDKVVGSLALVALSPVLALTALAIKLELAWVHSVQAEALWVQQRDHRNL